MERFPVELLYVLAFVAIVLFNFFAQRAARHRRQQEQAPAEAAPRPPPQDELPEDVWGRTATAPAPAPVPVVRAASQPPVRTESPRRAAFTRRAPFSRTSAIFGVKSSS